MADQCAGDDGKDHLDVQVGVKGLGGVRLGMRGGVQLHLVSSDLHVTMT